MLRDCVHGHLQGASQERCDEEASNYSKARPGQDPRVQELGVPSARRVKDLLSRMTLQEEAAQMLCIWQQKAQTLVDGDAPTPLRALPINSFISSQPKARACACRAEGSRPIFLSPQVSAVLDVDCLARDSLSGRAKSGDTLCAWRTVSPPSDRKVVGCAGNTPSTASLLKKSRAWARLTAQAPRLGRRDRALPGT